MRSHSPSLVFRHALVVHELLGADEDLEPHVVATAVRLVHGVERRQRVGARAGKGEPRLYLGQEREQALSIVFLLHRPEGSLLVDRCGDQIHRFVKSAAV